MKALLVLGLLLVVFCLSLNGTAVGADKDGQPRMRAAIGHLEAAKTAKEPVTSLRAARKALVNAKPNKEGERVDAIKQVDQAIAYATTGDRKTMLEKIDKALGNIKSGIARSK